VRPGPLGLQWIDDAHAPPDKKNVRGAALNVFSPSATLYRYNTDKYKFFALSSCAMHSVKSIKLVFEIVKRFVQLFLWSVESVI